MVDVTLYGLKRGDQAPPLPDNLDGPPPDAERTKKLDPQPRFLPFLLAGVCHRQLGFRSGLATKIIRAGNGTEIATEATKVTATRSRYLTLVVPPPVKLCIECVWLRYNWDSSSGGVLRLDHGRPAV